MGSDYAKTDERHLSPPIEPADDEMPLDDPAFARDCAELAIGPFKGPHYRLCTAVVTRSGHWGRVWRADLEHSDPTELPTFMRVVCWHSPEGHPRVWNDFAERPLFPNALSPATDEQVAAHQARIATARLLEPKVKILLSQWPPMSAIEAARPGATESYSNTLAAWLVRGDPQDYMVSFLSHVATKYLGAAEETSISQVVAAISRLDRRESSSDS